LKCNDITGECEAVMDSAHDIANEDNCVSPGVPCPGGTPTVYKKCDSNNKCVERTDGIAENLCDNDGDCVGCLGNCAYIWTQAPPATTGQWVLDINHDLTTCPAHPSEICECKPVAEAGLPVSPCGVPGNCPNDDGQPLTRQTCREKSSP
jgi:hypothetical protein